MKIKRLGNRNAIIITNANGMKVLISYSTPVAAIINGVEYRTEQFWGVTTSRHINLFVSETAEKKPQSFFEGLL